MILSRQYESFNSTTVQLIQPPSLFLKPVFVLFQFHNGTINTWLDYMTNTNKIQFQFHNGTINTYS